jgi:hypothetical protein
VLTATTTTSWPHGQKINTVPDVKDVPVLGRHILPTAHAPIHQTAADSYPGLPWSVLAAIGKVGTDHGRSTAPGEALGANVYNPIDAIFTAANYLCQNGADRGADVAGAVFAYNHADWYVTKVLAIVRIAPFMRGDFIGVVRPTAPTPAARRPGPITAAGG